MNDCEHIDLVTRNNHIYFCFICGATLCQVTGAIRDRHGNVIGNSLTPEFEPGPNVPISAVFDRLRVLAKVELHQAQDLLTMVQELAPHSNIDHDLDALAGLARKAALRQRVGHAYLWAIQDIRVSLHLQVDDAEFTKAVKNHPTERS